VIGIGVTRCDTRRREDMWIDESEHMRMYTCVVADEVFAVCTSDPSMVQAILLERYKVERVDQLPMPRSVTPASLTLVGEIDTDDMLPVEVITDELPTTRADLTPMVAALKWRDD
jgi:hypothetical protein